MMVIFNHLKLLNTKVTKTRFIERFEYDKENDYFLILHRCFLSILFQLLLIIHARISELYVNLLMAAFVKQKKSKITCHIPSTIRFVIAYY